MKTIIIPTDFSENALKAFEFCNDMFASTAESIIICHVFDIPRGGTSSLYHFTDKLRDQANEDMDDFKKVVSEMFPKLPNIKTMVLQGDFVVQTLTLAGDENADAIIMGTKGASGVKEVLIGSNASHMISSTDFPLFAVPLNYEPGQTEKLSLCYDGQDLKEEHGETLKKLAGSFQLPIDAIHFKTDEADLVNWSTVAQKLEPHAIEHEDIVAKNLDEGLKSLIDGKQRLLVFVRRKKSFWEGLFSSSHSRKAAMHINAPMLILPD